VLASAVAGVAIVDPLAVSDAISACDLVPFATRLLTRASLLAITHSRVEWKIDTFFSRRAHHTGRTPSYHSAQLREGAAEPRHPRSVARTATRRLCRLVLSTGTLLISVLTSTLVFDPASEQTSSVSAS
jgi:hypothetical protein